MNNRVELVAMGHPEAAAIGGDVECLFLQCNAAEHEAGIVAQHLVMVAGHEDHLGALASLAEEFLNDVVLGLRAIPGFLQPPAVDDVSDEIEMFRIRVPQEIEEMLGLAAARTQMDIGYPDRPVAVDKCFAAHGMLDRSRNSPLHI